MDILQIDHTRVDVIVVDRERRQPIGRPWLTLSIDIASRAVVETGAKRGYEITLLFSIQLSSNLVSTANPQVLFTVVPSLSIFAGYRVILH